MKRRLIRDVILIGMILLGEVKILLTMNEEKKRLENENTAEKRNRRSGEDPAE